MPQTLRLPSLPQKCAPAEQNQRQFDLSLARTEYNYMRSYLEGVPMAAGLPNGEKFSLDFEAKVLAVFLPLAENFKTVVLGLLKREIESDLPKGVFEAVEQSFEKLAKDFDLLHPKRDMEELKAFLTSLAAVPKALESLLNLPKDLARMAKGLDEVFHEFIKTGPTAFLKSSLFDMLDCDPGRNYLLPKSIADYELPFATYPQPMSLTIPRQNWMPSDDKPCEQDWYFGHLQIAGFNTTNLRGVVAAPEPNSKALVLSALQAKMPITDAILRGVLGDEGVSLEQAVREHRLYVVDFAQFEGATSDIFHNEQRYITAPIALFYWNPTPPKGYPPLTPGGAQGVLQPICIQLAQKFNAETAPIFTPNNCSDANDLNLLKWRAAKYNVNAVSAMQHESVAHLGDCHLIIEPIVVASNRQLSVQHPVLTLLKPHFRFTININDDALTGLIAPGGVVAVNVGVSIESTRALLTQAHMNWRWDENNPDQLFKLRGVDTLPSFPFRDDTRLLWTATRDFVSSYLRSYYHSDQDVVQDNELQAWIGELVSPLYCGFKGLNGLAHHADGSATLDNLDYLIDMVAQIIYIAGPQHASVNYAQFPLMSYMPSVGGTIYQAPPTRSLKLQSPDDLMAWYPPLDVALYTSSFEYLLSQVQFDTFGHYDSNNRVPYFADPRIPPLVADFQDALALIEIEIRKRNKTRPIPYPFQLPSMIPNSVSI